MEDETVDYQVNGWKQAISIIGAQQRALQWCVSKFGELNTTGVLPKDPKGAQEYNDIVMHALSTGHRYLDSMNK